jgi:hypothetical protein
MTKAKKTITGQLHQRHIYFSRINLGIIVLIFAIIGAIILIHSFAAPNPNLPGDLNGDNVVNASDLSLLLTNYNTTNSTADINGDGHVNVLDLSILLGHYGQSVATGAIPNHIETWAYDLPGTGKEGSTASGSLVRQWLTYAEGGNINSSKAVNDCHGGTPACKAMAYTDANLIYPSGSAPVAAAAQENWWLHDPGFTDSAHRITYTKGGQTNVYHLNSSVQAVDNWFKNYSDNGLNYDGLFMDDSAATLKDTLYGSGQSTSQEWASDSAVQAGHELLAKTLTKSDGTPFIQVNNGLPAQVFLNALANIQQTLNSQNVIGAITEDSPVQNGTIISQLYYGSLLDVMGYMIHASKFHALLSSATTPTGQFRRMQEGTVLLGYLPGKIVDWDNLEDTSTSLAVFPEEGIYPTQPLETMGTPSGTGCLTGSGSLCSSGGHNDVQVAPGVYRREFAACYNQGTLFGRCATIVNSTTAAVTVQSAWLSQSYSHQITFNGGDVQGGGTVNLTGASFTKGTTSVPAQDSLLLTP